MCKVGDIVKIIVEEDNYNQLGRVVEIDNSSVPFNINFDLNYDKSNTEWYKSSEIELVPLKEVALYKVKKLYV